MSRHAARRPRIAELFRARRHTALLVAIVSAFAVRPMIGDSGAAPIVFSIALLVLMLVALYNIQVDELVGEREALLAQRRRRGIVAWVLVSVAIAERAAVSIAPTPGLLLLSATCWFAFLAFITWCELRSVLAQKEVTTDTISMSISVYLLIGFTWGAFYIALLQVQPDAFSFGPTPGDSHAGQQHMFPILIYFSLSTLSTIGFGDITPLTLQARYAAVAEGITGQFYIAILVARLVALQMSVAQARR